eukprot:5283902-Pleurochrysis_carterae.AAC.3
MRASACACVRPRAHACEGRQGRTTDGLREREGQGGEWKGGVAGSWSRERIEARREGGWKRCGRARSGVRVRSEGREQGSDARQESAARSKATLLGSLLGHPRFAARRVSVDGRNKCSWRRGQKMVRETGRTGEQGEGEHDREGNARGERKGGTGGGMHRFRA